MCVSRTRTVTVLCCVCLCVSVSYGAGSFSVFAPVLVRRLTVCVCLTSAYPIDNRSTTGPMADSNHHQQNHPSTKLPSETTTTSASPAAVASSVTCTKNGGVPSAVAVTVATKVAVLLSPLQEHSCEICGASGLSDDCMREHTRTCHVEGSAQCPFCGLSGVAPAELLLHVNQAHLDYLTPDNELMSFIDDQSPRYAAALRLRLLFSGAGCLCLTCVLFLLGMHLRSVDGDSDSMSECPNGYTNGPQTHANGAAAKLNGGACVSHAAHKPPSASTSAAAQPLTAHHQLHQNGHSHANHHSNHSAHSHHQCTVAANGSSSSSSKSTKGQQTKITNFYKKSMSADATHSECDGVGCSGAAAHHRTMHSTLKATHETRSCDNQDVLGAAGGRDYQMVAAAAVTSTSSASTSAVTGSGGGEGSPLRSQLGLNLKSHAPATAVKPSPLQVEFI